MNLQLLGIGLRFALYLLLQVTFFNLLTLWHLAEAHVYLGFLLFLPLEMPRLQLYSTALLYGVLLALLGGQIEVLGAYVFTMPTLLAIRAFWVLSVTPNLALTDKGGLAFGKQGLGWFMSYVLPLCFVYELILQPLASWDFSWRLLLQIILTSLYSTALLLIAFALFYRKRA